MKRTMKVKRILAFLMVFTMLVALIPGNLTLTVRAKEAEDITYNDNDYNQLVVFAEQGDNLAILGWDLEKPGEWAGVTWQTQEDEEHIRGIEFTNLLLSGTLDLTDCISLEYIYIYGNLLTSLDVSGNTALKWLDCYENQLTELNVSGNTVLEWLDCSENQLTNLNVSESTRLISLSSDENQLSELNVSGATALLYLKCNDNQLDELDVSQNTALMRLYCSDNQLDELDVSKNMELVTFYCSENQLTEMKISEHTALQILHCENNQLTDLEVSGATALTGLSCYNNQLESLDVCENLTLSSLFCYDNRLTMLDVSLNTALTELSCSKNQLTELDVSGNTKLTFLSCSKNQLTELDVSGNTELTELSCSENQLTELDVSGNTVLTDLRCSENQLTELDVSGNTVLYYLNCSENQLTELDVSGNMVLYYLYCYKNRLDLSENSQFMLQVEALIADGVWVIYSPQQEDESITYTYNDHDYNQLVAFAEQGDNLTILGWNLDEPGEWTGVTWQTQEADEAYIEAINFANLGLSGTLKLNDCISLTYLDLSYNNLTSLDVSGNTALERLYCYGNQLTKLDVSGNTALRYLICYGNQLTELDIFENTALRYLECDENRLDLSENSPFMLQVEALIADGARVIYSPQQEDAALPIITKEPISVTKEWGTTVTIEIQASTSDGGTLSYQWYRNSANRTTDAVKIPEATSATYHAPISTIGTTYYFCVVTNTNDFAYKKPAIATSEIAAVVVTAHKLTGNSVTLTSASYVYDGKSKTPAVTVKDGNTTLTQDKDYTVTYAGNCINAGSYSVIVTGKSGYAGAVTKPFTITKGTQTITASNKTKALNNTSFNLGAKLSTGDGKLSYRSNNPKICMVSPVGKVTIKGCGKATVTVTAAETTNCKKEVKQVTITVVPKKATVSKVTSPSTKKIKTTWKKDSTTTGYEIQLATNKSFTSGKKTKGITKNGTTGYTFTGLTKGKTYYVRVRAYKTIDGKKQYGAWSAAGSVKSK